jgi:hypothetical protein
VVDRVRPRDRCRRVPLQVGESGIERGIEVPEEDVPHEQPVLARAHSPADRVPFITREPLPRRGEVAVPVEELGQAGAVKWLPVHRPGVHCVASPYPNE